MARRDLSGPDSFKEIQSLSIACDNSHPHAAWGKTFHPDTGLEVWATSLEARYPQKLCVAVVHVVLQVLHSQGLQLLPDSISAIADSPLHRSQLTSVALNKQRISGKIPPLIPDFSRVQVISLPTDEVVPVSVLSKLQKAWNPDPQYHYLLGPVCFDAHVKSRGLKMVCMNQNAMCKS